MAFQKCQSCFKIEGATVAYEATADELILTLVDPCCRYNNCKAIRAVLASAAIALYEGDVVGVSLVDCPCCCDDLPFLPTAEWMFGSKSVAFPGDFSTVDPTEGEFEVPAPYAYGV